VNLLANFQALLKTGFFNLKIGINKSHLLAKSHGFIFPFQSMS